MELPAFIADNVPLWWACIASRIPELIIIEPASDPFNALYRAISEVFKLTGSSKVRQLLKGYQLGDRKPTALYNLI